jgi:mRNA-degrading endonuclease toxin of MazEF toxin-antitoxin module
VIVKRGDVWLARSGTLGADDAHRLRAWLVVSPPEWNDFLKTVVAVPVTAATVAAPYRPRIRYGRDSGFALLDRPRTLDKARLVRRAGKATPSSLGAALMLMQEAFAP